MPMTATLAPRSLLWLLLPVALVLSACGSGPAVVSMDQMAKPRLDAAQLGAMSDDDLQAQRDALANTRTQAQAAYRQAEAQCWQHFAVTRCTERAAQARRNTLDQLRADDVAVQDEQRKRRLQAADERLKGKLPKP